MSGPHADAVGVGVLATCGDALAPAQGVTGEVYSANNPLNGRSFWAVLASASAAFALLGGLASLLLPRTGQRERTRFPFGSRTSGFGRELGRAGRATVRGLGSGAEGLWDVLLEGSDAVRAQAKVARDVGDSLRETGESLRRAVGHLGGSIVGFVLGTVSALGFLSALAAVLTFVYLPDRDRRERFFAQIKNWVGR